MGITLLTFGGLFAPLRQLAGWLAGAAARSPQRIAQPPVPVPGGGRRPRSTWPAAQRGALPARRPLRVVRVMDGSHAPASAGRMVISGRMADVCAELDRLTASESGRPC